MDELGEAHVAYRAWGVKGNELWSTNGHHRWEVGENQAICNPPSGLLVTGAPERAPHEVPDVDCGCGIYAYYTPQPRRVRYDELLGVILVWGGVVTHESRLRAEWAEIVALLVPSSFKRPSGPVDLADPNAKRQADAVEAEWKRIEAVSRHYGVPVIQTETVAQAQDLIEAEYGPHIPEKMRRGADGSGATQMVQMSASPGRSAQIRFAGGAHRVLGSPFATPPVTTPPSQRLWLTLTGLACVASFATSLALGRVGMPSGLYLLLVLIAGTLFGTAAVSSYTLIQRRKR